MPYVVVSNMLQWHVAWQYQAIAWTSVGFSSIWSCGTAFSVEMILISIMNTLYIFRREWMEGPMENVDPDSVEQEVGNIWRALYKLEKGFDSVPAAKKICHKVCLPCKHSIFGLNWGSIVSIPAALTQFWLSSGMSTTCFDIFGGLR